MFIPHLGDDRGIVMKPNSDSFPDNVPDSVLRSIARVLLPDILEDLCGLSPDSAQDDCKSDEAL